MTNYINKPTRRTFCTYLFYNLCTTLHVTNDHFVHHLELMIYCICSSVQTMQMSVWISLKGQRDSFLGVKWPTLKFNQSTKPSVHISGLADANYPTRLPCGDPQRDYRWRLHPHHAPYSVQSHVQKHWDTEAGGIPATWFAVQLCGLGHHGTRKSPRYSSINVIVPLKRITIK